MVRLSRGNVLFLVAWVLAGLVVVAVASGGGLSCQEWQERYEAAAAGGTGTLDFVNMGPMAELRAERPEGCPVPE